MNREDIIRTAREAGFGAGIVEFIGLPIFERFVELVAKHTLMNTDPNSFMSYQEGFESGNRLAIEGFCRQLRQLHDSYSLASDPSGLKPREKA